MRICIIYDCLYPYTIGGAERWYRNLADKLAEQGHDVTYLTRRQWGARERVETAGFRVIAVAPRTELYANGRRRILPPILFGLGTFWHLIRFGRRYDVVHTASFPYFSLLAAGLTRRLGGFRLIVDWHEVWTREYWCDYLGDLGGTLGWFIQKRCLSIRQRAYCFSRLHERRLHEYRVRGPVIVLRGQFEGEPALELSPADSLVVFAGRHISEKRPEAVVHAVARARSRIPGLRAAVYGDGPERRRVLAAIAANDLQEAIEAPGFVDREDLDNVLARALCLVLPSEREGYGLVVLEALSRGTPAIVTADDDNAATEFIIEGVNGFIAASPSADVLAAAIVAVHRSGKQLRESTLDHFAHAAPSLSMRRSVEIVAEGSACE
jgi:glycosyltransferase involved in cell wall biosynthesis